MNEQLNTQPEPPKNPEIPVNIPDLQTNSNMEPMFALLRDPEGNSVDSLITQAFDEANLTDAERQARATILKKMIAEDIFGMFLEEKPDAEVMNNEIAQQMLNQRPELVPIFFVRIKNRIKLYVVKRLTTPLEDQEAFEVLANLP